MKNKHLQIVSVASILMIVLAGFINNSNANNGFRGITNYDSMTNLTVENCKGNKTIENERKNNKPYYRNNKR